MSRNDDPSVASGLSGKGAGRNRMTTIPAMANAASVGPRRVRGGLGTWLWFWWIGPNRIVGWLALLRLRWARRHAGSLRFRRWFWLWLGGFPLRGLFGLALRRCSSLGGLVLLITLGQLRRDALRHARHTGWKHGFAVARQRFLAGKKVGQIARIERTATGRGDADRQCSGCHQSKIEAAHVSRSALAVRCNERQIHFDAIACPRRRFGIGDDRLRPATYCLGVSGVQGG